MSRLLVAFVFLRLVCTIEAAEPVPAFTAAGIDFFEKRIRPLLIDACYDCHSANGEKIRGGLRVDSRAALITGGESGSALSPGSPQASRIIEAVTYRNASLQMPPRKKLSDGAIADLTQWVKMGAPWPAEKPDASPPEEKPAIDFEARRRDHWAWQPVKKHEPPAVKNEAWVRNDIDRFILAKLEANQLSPSPEADPRTLIRRVTFDLTGLPPTAEEVAAFVKEWEKESSEFRVQSSELKGKGEERHGGTEARRHEGEEGKRESEKAGTREIGADKSEIRNPTASTAAQAAKSEIASTQNSELGTRNLPLPEPETRNSSYSRLVDRLLASPQYGQRQARHWLDVVRFADSKDSRGMGGEADIPFAYRYRDWVIDAFNRDLPYDRFIMQQIAGDIKTSSEFRVPSSELKGSQGKERRIETLKSAIRNPTASTAAQAAKSEIVSTRNSELETRNYSSLIATTMLAIGNWDAGDSDKRKMMSDIVDDQVDVISRGFLGMTIACARCHDHKFDPISTRDYYALAGFFFSSHIIPAPGDPTAGSPMLRLPLMSETQLAAIGDARRRVEELRRQINVQVDVHRREVITRELGRIKAYMAATEELHRSADRDDPVALTAIAARHGIHAAILKRFVRYIGLTGAGGTVPGMFTTKLSEVGRSPLVSGWGEPATPSVLAHTGHAPLKLLTFTLPPRSVAMHPSPTKHVAIGWRSKFTGIVAITGSAADADSACGNGFAWSIIHQRAGIITLLASGELDNGGSQTFAQGDTAKRLAAVQVEPGDLISLVIDARGREHACDTTAIRFTLREAAGGRREWDVTRDVVDSILASNPHADRHGQRDIWHFYAISEDGGEGDAKVPAGSLLAQWLASVTDPRLASDAQAKQSREQLAQAIHQLANSGEKPPANQSPANLALHKDFITASSPLWSTIDLPAYSELDRAPLDAMRTELAAQSKLASTKIEHAQGIAEGGVPGSEHAGFRDAKVHIRGRYDRLGETVPRGFPALIAATPQAAIKEGSGRLELAQWIASPRNTMTARVMVNRLWQHHFGRGLVATPDNFGHLGSPPSHPELLDHLATQFIAQGWSMKAMHRMIVMSATYRQDSGRHEGTEARRHEGERQMPAIRTDKFEIPNPKSLDPDNLLLRRQNRHRLDAEQLRDAMLAVTNQLDRSASLTPGPGTTDIASPRRSIYLMAIRSDRSTYRMLFDGADPTASIHARNESTIAPQALFMLNHPFALNTAKALAKLTEREGPTEDERKIAWLYERLFARPATPREIEIGLRLLREAASGDKAAAWTQYCQVLLCANEFVYID